MGFGRRIREIRRRTSKPFAVNLLVTTEVEASKEEVWRTQELLAPYRKQLGVEESALTPIAQPFEQQMEVLVEERVPVFSFTFDIPPRRWLDRLREQGTVLIGTSTTVREAEQLEAAGVDCIVAQGAEAGGHRGTFAVPYDRGMIGTMALIPQTVDRVNLPVIAAGGIMDGRGMAAALALGAEGIQMGTAFLTCRGSGAHPAHQEKILTEAETETVITRAFSGKPARGIRNRMIDELSGREQTLPPYPVQNALTQGIRKAAARKNDPEWMSLWAGQGLGLAGEWAAGELVQKVIEEAETIVQRGSQARS